MTDSLYGKSKICARRQHSARQIAMTQTASGAVLTVFTFMPVASERRMTAALDALGSPMMRSVRGSERKRKWWMPVIHGFAACGRREVSGYGYVYVYVWGVRQRCTDAQG